MKINVFTMMIVINLVAALSVILSIVLLFFPFGRNLPGSGENASAITSSIAIIVATLGLVIATYMQSAEYRRESEVVDGIQGLRLLLELMIAEISVIEYHKVKKDERPRRAFELEQESLLKTLQGSAGRFLFYYAAVRSRSATEQHQPEKWRLLHIHIAMILSSADIIKCNEHVIELYLLIKEICTDDIKRLSNGFISAKSIDEMNTLELNVLLQARIGVYKDSSAKDASDPFANNEDLEAAIVGLKDILMKDEQGRKAFDELQEDINKARSGDIESRRGIFLILGALNNRQDASRS